MRPILRFTHFTENYIKSKLKNYVAIYDGTHETPNYVDKGIKFISVENIKNLLKTDKYIPENDYNKYKIKPKYNDVFMTRIGDIGTPAIYKSNDPLAYYVSLALLRSKNESFLYPDYLKQYISNQRFQKELHDRTIHVAFPKKINTGEIGECNINFPSYNEQVKVSNFLSLLDKKIELQSKKIEDLKLFKKGLIHQMKKSSNNLVEYKISEIFKITRGVVIPKKDLSENKTNKYIYPVYSSQTSNNGILGYDEKFDFDGKYLTWTTDGANAGKVFFRNGKFRCTNVCGVLYNDNNKYVNELTAEILNYETPKYVSYVGNPKLMNNVMGDIKVFLPDIDKSDRVSNILLTINNKFLLEKNKLSKLNELKNGLMQCMFV